MLRGRRILPGLSGEARAWDDRLSIKTSEIYGLDLVGSRRVETSRQLAQGANWERQAEFSFTAPSSEHFTLSMSGGLYDARRPIPYGHQRLQLGQIEDWAEHQGGDIGVTLGLLGGRLRYEGGYAWSDYARELNFGELGRLTSPKASSDEYSEAGAVHRHRFEADLLTGGPVGLSAYGLYQTGDPEFVRARRNGASLPFSRTAIRELGASLEFEGLRFEVTDRILKRQASEKHRIEGEVNYGPITLSLFREAYTRGLSERSRRRQDIVGGEVEFDFDEHRHGGAGEGSFAARKLLPSAVSIGAEFGRTRFARAPEDPESSETTLSLGLYWGWDWADTDLSIYRRSFDSRTAGAESADETEYGFDLSQGFYGNWWDLLVYLSVGSFSYDEIENRWQDLWGAGGLALSYYPEHLPDATVSLNFNHYAGALPDYDWRFRQQGLSLDLSIDLSKYLPDAASMQLHYSALSDRTFDSYVGRSSDLGHAASLRFAARF